MSFQWIDLGNGRKVYRRIDRQEVARSHLPAPMVRADGMSQETWCPVDGRVYDSKSAYYAAVKAAGCEVVGCDSGHWDKPAPSYEPKGVKEDIVAAMKQQGAI